MMTLRFALWNRLAAALVALSLAILGFGHASASGNAPDSMVLAWIQSGGSLDDLCLSAPGQSDQGHHAECPACTLTKSVILAMSVAASAPATRLVARLPFQSAGHLADKHAPRSPLARGPPTLFT